MRRDTYDSRKSIFADNGSGDWRKNCGTWPIMDLTKASFIRSWYAEGGDLRHLRVTEHTP